MVSARSRTTQTQFPSQLLTGTRIWLRVVEDSLVSLTAVEDTGPFEFDICMDSIVDFADTHMHIHIASMPFLANGTGSFPFRMFYVCVFVESW